MTQHTTLLEDWVCTWKKLAMTRKGEQSGKTMKAKVEKVKVGGKEGGRKKNNSWDWTKLNERQQEKQIKAFQKTNKRQTSGDEEGKSEMGRDPTTWTTKNHRQHSNIFSWEVWSVVQLCGLLPSFSPLASAKTIVDGNSVPEKSPDSK